MNHDGWASTFTADGTCGVYDPGADVPFYSATGRDEPTTMLHGVNQYPVTFHSMANHHVTVDGDTAHGVVYGSTPT